MKPMQEETSKRRKRQLGVCNEQQSNDNYDHCNEYYDHCDDENDNFDDNALEGPSHDQQ